MNRQIELDLFAGILERKPELAANFPHDLKDYYQPFAEKLIEMRQQRGDREGLIVGISAIQGAGKTTQGEVMEVLLGETGHPMVSVSIDDHYLTHKELCELRADDPRFIRRGVTHDISLAQDTLASLRLMKDGQPILVPVYYKGAHSGDGERYRWVTPQDEVSLVAQVIETEMMISANLQAVRALHLEEVNFRGQSLQIPSNMGSDIPLLEGVIKTKLLNFLNANAKVGHAFSVAVDNRGGLKTVSFETIDISQHSLRFDASASDLPPGWKVVDRKPSFIFYDGWMVGARPVADEGVFESGLPALETPSNIDFAKFVNRKLAHYLPLWDKVDFQTVLYVPNYHRSLDWREQAELPLRARGQGMTPDQIRQFVYYFWRSVHPGIHISNLARDTKHTDQVILIRDDHSIGPTITPDKVDEMLKSES